MPVSLSVTPQFAPRSETEEFAFAVLDGLSKAQKTLPCRYFYDARGSELFETITQLPEYYPTRAEAAILERHAADIAAAMPQHGVLVEFGSGSSRKTEMLLRVLPNLSAYVPIDVSHSALDDARQRVVARFPKLDVRPLAADFSSPLIFPPDLAARPKTGFFPGSTIGNLTPPHATSLLASFRKSLQPNGRLIVGVDLKKDPCQLVLAYKDASGITAAFNLNLLVRIQRELGATLDLDAFRHDAIYDPAKGRVEMHLVSVKAQDVRVLGRRFRFHEGETIHTENSYKYTIGEFRAVAADAGWQTERVWTDAAHLFSVHELTST